MFVCLYGSVAGVGQIINYNQRQTAVRADEVGYFFKMERFRLATAPQSSLNTATPSLATHK